MRFFGDTIFIILVFFDEEIDGVVLFILFNRLIFLEMIWWGIFCIIIGVLFAIVGWIRFRVEVDWIRIGADGWDWEMMSFWEFRVEDKVVVFCVFILVIVLFIVEEEIGWMIMGVWLEDFLRLFNVGLLLERVIFLLVVVIEFGWIIILLLDEFWDDNDDEDGEVGIRFVIVGLNFFVGEEILFFIIVFRLRFIVLFIEFIVIVILGGNVIDFWVVGIFLIS